MMKEVVCNYAIARFRPYRETGEFVNVGLVLVCPETGFFGHRFEAGDHQRIASFFPELELDVFLSGLNGLIMEMDRVTTREQQEHQNQPVLREGTPPMLTRFRELVRPREALFLFSEARTILAADPCSKLQELFDHYIAHQRAVASSTV
ncbi:MAG: DUF3037 domain-containing protein [Verrucomicrobiota bacterium]